ncbi:MAG: hypothetical protein WCG44_03570 [bacterium]
MNIRRGTSIIEVVIATALISVAIISALSLANSSQKQNTYARGLAEGTKYATQAADWIRTQRNTLGFATIASKDAGLYCINNLPVDFSLSSPSPCDSTYIKIGTEDTKYQRTLTLTSDGSKVTATIVVSWLENTPRQSTIQVELTQW